MAMDKKNIAKNYLTDLESCISKVERLSSCIEISNLINAELSTEKLLSNVMKITKKILLADAVSMLLVDDKTDDLTFYVSLGNVGEKIQKIYKLKRNEGIAGLVARTGSPMNIEDVYQHASFSRKFDEETDYRTRAMLCAPLKIRGKIIGVIQVINKLVKPFVFSDEELNMLITISSSAAVALDTAKMHKIILKRETLERDLKLAKEVQESFLPQELPAIENYRFAALNQPALEIGGDFYNFFKMPGNKMGIVLGDVSGKGISASLFMARLTSDLQYYALLYPDPKELLTRINQMLCDRAKRGMFVTLVYMLLDTEKNQVKIANAGHLCPIYSSSSETELLCNADHKGPPLGIIEGIEYTQEKFELEEESSVTVYTDGIIEAKNYKKELFGAERLIEEINRHTSDPDLIIKKITDKVDKFIKTEGRSDDFTIVVFSRGKKQKTPLHLSVKSHPENLKHIRKMVADSLSEARVPEHDSHIITLAVDEACSNIIKHGYKNDYNRKIDLFIDLEINCLTISIIDSGIKFDISSIEPRDVNDIRPGKLGLHIINEVMDKVMYSQTEDGFNKIEMIKKLIL